MMQYSAMIHTLQSSQHLHQLDNMKQTVPNTHDANNIVGDSLISKVKQQEAMVSLAIVVCNYADLFIMANNQTIHHQQHHHNKHLTPQYVFLFSALKALTTQMLDSLNKVFITGLISEITNSHPEAKDQFTLYTAHLLDASTHETNKQLDEIWGKRDIIEGNERLLVKMMSYLTNNNECIGGESVVNPILNRIDGLLDGHLHLLEHHRQHQQT